MNIHIYQGSLGLVGKSGVGQAARHQQLALQRAGIAVTKGWQPPAQAVHINTVLPCSVWAARRARRQKIPVIWYGHSTEQDFRHSFAGSDLLAPLFRCWLCFCYNQADLILTPTPYAAGILGSYGLKPPVRVLSNGVDTQFFAPDAAAGARFRRRFGLGQQDKAVISVGHFMQRKGILEFLQLARQTPQAQFLWFGYTDPRLVPSKIRRAIKNAPANVRFPGYISQEQLREAYCGADAFVFCSHEETEGIVVLEALACGTPTIVRDIPVYRDWLQDGKNVYKAVTQEEFYDTLQGILQGTFPSLAAAGRRTAEERSLETIGQKLKGIYTTLCPL